MAHAETSEEADFHDPEYARAPNAEPIPGYRLLEPLGRGGFGEVWKCEAPGGLLKAIKFVQGGLHALDANAPAEEELRAIQRVKAIRHPFILSMERVERVGGELVIVLELADTSLLELLHAERAEGRPGIPRDALLGYLREAAEALDVMNARYQLQHLDIKPQNLFLVGNHVKVADFGLVSSLQATGGALKLGAITPVYASPEVFQGGISRHSDQYSLAIVYQELLTGTLPFTGKNARQYLLRHTQGTPDLRPLPEFDRAVVARALAKDPAARFPSCSDFIHALVAGQTEVVLATGAADTRRTPAVKAVQVGTVCARPPLPEADGGGLELLDLVSRTPLTEVWNARAHGDGAGGGRRLVKVIFGPCARADEGAARLGQLRHPNLAPIEVLHQAPGRLVLAITPGERTLRDGLQECQAQGLPGIPRDRLLGYLGEAAEALDALAQEHGLQHFWLNPRTLMLNGEQVVLTDFGLAQLLWLPGGQPVAALNARYSAPELSAGQLSPSCDQYSLALVYHELLTGSLPAEQASGPNLARLPEANRPAVARALDPEPQRRWGGCRELIRALEAAGAPAGVHPVPRPRAPRPSAQGAGAGDVLQARFGTTLTPDVIPVRLDGFRRQWKGKVLSADPRHFVFQMQTPTSFWQRWIGRQPGLEVHIRLGSPPRGTTEGVPAATEVHVDIRPLGGQRESKAELLEVIGPLLVESVRGYLQVNPRGRQEERLVWQHPLEVCAVLPDGSLGPPVECHGKDISLNGIGFYLPGELPGSEVLLHLPQTPQTPKLSVRARVVRAQGCGDDWYEVGAILLHD